MGAAAGFHDGRIDLTKVPKLTQVVQTAAQQVAQQTIEQFAQDQLVHQAVHEATEARNEVKRLTLDNQRYLAEIEALQTRLQQTADQGQANLQQAAQQGLNQLKSVRPAILIPIVAGIGLFLATVMLIFWLFFKIGG